MRRRFSIAVHGGAGRLARSKTVEPGRRPYDAGVRRSLAAAIAILERGGSAVRAVAAAVSVLEDDEHFNAGRGAALCMDGSVELSASIMNGSNLSVGAMVGLKRTRNPVQAAQTLMGHSHCLLFGENADAYAEQKGVPMADPEYFQTLYRLQQWKRARGRSQARLDHHDDEDAHGTVGAVALDRRGRFAAATSTGGIVNQLPGRVGDSPVVGAGTWANHLCAISATGTGDVFFRLAFARRVADLIELGGRSGAAAADKALAEVASKRGQGGCILIDSDGEIHCPHISSHMVRGWIQEGESAKVAILAQEAVSLALG